MVRNNSMTRRCGRPGEKGKQLVKIIETNPYNDPENFSAAEHAKALGGNVDIWGTPIMKRAAIQRKGYDVFERTDGEKLRMIKKAMEKDAMMIVKQGMPNDPQLASELTEKLGPGTIVRLLELRRMYLEGLIK